MGSRPTVGHDDPAELRFGKSRLSHQSTGLPSRSSSAVKARLRTAHSHRRDSRFGAAGRRGSLRPRLTPAKTGGEGGIRTCFSDRS